VTFPRDYETAPPSPASLAKWVREFTEALKREFSRRMVRRSKAFKRRVLALVAVNLPPYPKPTGRPRQPRITEAATMYAAQLREVQQGMRKAVNWRPIAQRCIPGYNAIRSNDTRRAALDRLRDSVYARSASAKQKQRKSHSEQL
jgi:hypothetical protein